MVFNRNGSKSSIEEDAGGRMMDECNGCKHEESTDITICLGICTYCKRCYSTEEEREMHDDLYAAKEGKR